MGALVRGSWYYPFPPPQVLITTIDSSSYSCLGGGEKISGEGASVNVCILFQFQNCYLHFSLPDPRRNIKLQTRLESLKTVYQRFMKFNRKYIEINFINLSSFQCGLQFCITAVQTFHSINKPL